MKCIFALFLLFSAPAQAGGPEGGDKPLKEGLELLEAGELDGAEALADKIPREDRGFLLGYLYFYRGDYPDAAAEMGKSTPGERRSEMLAYLDKLVSITGSFDEYPREHFKIRLSRADGIIGSYLDDEILDMIYAAVGKKFGYYPQDKVLIEVYPAKEEFAFASTLGNETVDRSGAIGISKFNRIMLLSPRVLPYGYRWIDAICHEYIHFVVNRITRHNCPLWLHEGIARYCETCWRSELPVYPSPSNVNELAAALKSGKLISFRRMHPSMVYLDNQDEVELAFAEVCSAVRYLDESSPSALNGLLNGMAAGEPDRVFRKVLRTDIGGFESAWLKRLKKGALEESPGVMDDKVRWKKAASEIDEFVGVNARDHLVLGDRLRRNGDYKGALYQYGKALEIEKYNPVILSRSAKALFALGNSSEGENRLKECVQKNPNYVTAYELLGEQYLGRKEYAMSAEALAEAAAINPFNPFTHRNLGISFLGSGKKVKAYKELSIARLLNPGDTELNGILSGLEGFLKGEKGQQEK